MTARRAYAWLAASLMLFTVYVSLLPFRLRFVPLDLAWTDFAWAMTLWPRRLPRANFLANLLLFVPIGFGLAGAQLADRARARRGVMAAALLCSVAVSLTAEFVQVFAPGRVVSNLDVVAQTVGCVMGLAAWALVGQAVTTWLRETRAHTSHSRLTRALVGYVVLWVFANWAPFDITLDPARLARRLRDGSIAIVPFTQPMTPRLLWDAVVTAVSTVPIGLLAVSGWWTRPARRGAVAAMLVAVGGITLVEAAQAFIRSHASNGTDVLCGAIGAGCGVYAGTRLWRAEPVDTENVGSGWAWAGLAVWCLMLAGYHWQPFDFAVDTGLIRQKFARLSLVPLAGYRSGSDLAAFNNLVAKVATAVPFGVIAAFAWPRGMGWRLALVAWIALSTVVFGLVEVGQFFLPSRVPDPTDVWLGVIAGSAGLWLGRWLRAGYRAPGVRAAAE